MNSMITLAMLIKTNLKILKSRSYLIFIFVCIIIPVALNLSITIYFEMILPISAGFFFSNMMFIERKIGIDKQYYMTIYNKGHIFLIRTIINLIFYFYISFAFYFYLIGFGLDNFADEYAYEHLNIVHLIFVVGGINYLFFGLSTTLISTVANNPIVGLLVSASYGLIWMSQYTNISTFIFNPFPYSSGNNEPYVYKAIYLFFVLVLAKANYCYVKSFFLSIRV